MVVWLSMPLRPSRSSSLAAGTMSRTTVSQRSVVQFQPTAPGTWPWSYAAVSTSTSTTRTPVSRACCATQSVETRTSGTIPVAIWTSFEADDLTSNRRRTPNGFFAAARCARPPAERRATASSTLERGNPTARPGSAKRPLGRAAAAPGRPSRPGGTLQASKRLHIVSRWMTRRPLYIDGEFVDAQSGGVIDVIDPATGELLAQTADAGPADVDRAVRAARAAFDHGPWREATAQDRGRVLFELARIVRARAAELAEIETRNSGKPIVEAEFDVADAATCFEYYGGLATKIHGDVNPVPDDALSLTMKEPVGVCGQIIPWNYPLLMAAWKIAPALCAGCTVVLKPAEATPLTALELAKLLDGIPELPKGVVNIVTGDGPIVGAALASSEHVDKVAFTGSTRTGRSILRAAADSNMKRVTLELGGKSPNIFFADANWEAAVEGAVF